MKRTIIIVYAVFIHAVLAALFFKTDALHRFRVIAGLSEPAAPQIKLMQKLFHERRDPSVPDGAEIFLGDSITFGYATANAANRSVNYGIGQQTASQLIDSLPGYKSLMGARRIYLMIGVNDIINGTSAELPEKIRVIASLLPKSVPVIWSGLMPTDQHGALIQQINPEIRSVCAAMPNCIYVDTFAKMTTPDGHPITGFFLDGVHPSASGYAAWTKMLLAAKH